MGGVGVLGQNPEQLQEVLQRRKCDRQALAIEICFKGRVVKPREGKAKIRVTSFSVW